MDPITLASAILAVLGNGVLRSVLAVARRAILIALVTLLFIVVAVTCLILSGIVFTGWWQAFFLEAGVGLLIAGIVDVAVLGALHGLIEGTTGESPQHQAEPNAASGTLVRATHKPDIADVEE